MKKSKSKQFVRKKWKQMKQAKGNVVKLIKEKTKQKAKKRKEKLIVTKKIHT